MKTKTLYQPPLPFQGNKREFIKTIIPLLLDLEQRGIITKDTIFVDVFGGSGIISHNIKLFFRKNRVVWNDFDNYQQRLDNIEATNELVAKIYQYNNTKEKGIYKRLDKETKEKILEVITKEIEERGFVDYLTLSGKFLFSDKFASNYVELSKNDFYFRGIEYVPYKKDNYLEGVERISLDFVEVFEMFKNKKAFLIIDPPYLFTAQDDTKAWGAKDFLRLVSLLKPPFMLFSNCKSQILDFLECFSGFDNIKIHSRQRQMSKDYSYTDYLILQENKSNKISDTALFQKIGVK